MFIIITISITVVVISVTLRLGWFGLQFLKDPLNMLDAADEQTT